MRWRWAALAAVVVAVLGLGALALGGGDGDGVEVPLPGVDEGPEEPDEAQRQRGPFAVGTRAVTFVDDSRPTAATATQPEQPSRTLVTDLWYPAAGPPEAPDAADAPAAEGRFPLVLFSHGQSGAPLDYGPVLRQWARAGYVVAAPRHPLTIRGLEGGPYTGDYVNQPADLSFVADRLGEELGDLVDPEHLAAVGHSSGALSALGMAYHDCCRDDRVDAVVLEAGLLLPFEGEYDFSSGPPALALHGDADTNFSIQGGRRVYEQLPAPKAFLTILGGNHSGPYRTGERDSPMVAEAVVAFLDRHVKERPDAEPLPAVVARHPVGALEEVAEA